MVEAGSWPSDIPPFTEWLVIEVFIEDQLGMPTMSQPLEQLQMKKQTFLK